MVDERQPSKVVKVVAKVVATIIGSVFTLSLFAFCYLLGTQAFDGPSDEMTFTRWLFLAGAAMVLLCAVSFAAAIYDEWFPKTKLTGPLERRGSPSFGEVRDDGFERHLNWMRSHKRLVKVIEFVNIGILIVVWIAILWVIKR